MPVAGLIKAIGAVLGQILSALPYLLTYKAGKDSVTKENAENAARIQRKQLEIAARRRASRADILRRMRDGEL